MKTIKQTGLLMAAAAFCAAPTFAQTPVKLLSEGDATGWSGDMIIDFINDLSVNDLGDYLIDADGGSDITNDQGVLHNGSLLYMEGSNMSFPASHTMVGGNDWVAGTSFDTIDINDNGDILVTCVSCADVNAILPTRNIVMWTNGVSNMTYALIEEDLTPADTLIVPMGSGLDEPVGAVWVSIAEVWQNNNNQMVFSGRTDTDSDDLLVFLEHDGAGTILSQTLLASDGVRFDLIFGAPGTHQSNVASLYVTRVFNSLNDNGDFLFPIDDDGNALPATNDDDGHMYTYNHAAGTYTEVMHETDLSPTGSGFPWGHPSSFEVDLNDDGSYIVSGDDDGASSGDNFILYVDAMGTPSIFIQEGDLLPDFDPMLGYTCQGSGFGAVALSDSGDISWVCDTSEPQGVNDTVFYRNMSAILIEGVTPMPGTDGLVQIGTGSTELVVSDNGRYAILELDVEPVGGNPASSSDDLEGAYLLDFGSLYADFCNGDGGDQLGCTNCPCGNNAPVGTVGGCVNSASTSARLEASGDASVSLPSGSTSDLRFRIAGAPALAFCILNSGDNVAPTGMANPCFGLNSGTQAMQFDGLRCAVGNTLRHGGRSADANGDVGVTNNPWGGEGAPAVGIAQQGAGFASGQTRYFQVINRDDPLAVCGRGLNTSQAVEVTFTP